MADTDALLRWRLILGREVEDDEPALELDSLLDERKPEAQSARQDPAPEPEQDRDRDDIETMDRSLQFLYGAENRGADLSDSLPYVPTWLDDIRRCFDHDTVVLLEKDAIEQRGLKTLLFEPEILPRLERNVALVSTLLALKEMLPEKAKDAARAIVKEVVEKLTQRLEQRVKNQLSGALNRGRRSPIPRYKNIDWQRTIAKNLRHYDVRRRRLVPAKFYFWSNQKKFADWHVIVCVDQSLSMVDSLVYSSVMASIFASLSVLKTQLFLFDTSVVDMTEHVSDPVEILFRAQLGGGTDIASALACISEHVVQPSKTILVLISDFYEGGSESRLLQTAKNLVEGGTRLLCLLALSDSGAPAYDSSLTRRLAALGAPGLACTPERLADTVENIIKAR